MWWYVVVFVVALVVAYAMTPKPKSQTPNTLADVQAPTADVGTEIPVLFGRRLIYGNVVWYGDFRAAPIFL